MKKIIYLCTFALLAAACGQGPQIMPNITGRAGELLVVIDKPNWDDTLGKSIRHVLAAEYPAIPQIEPVFDLVQVAPNGFTRLFEPHRNILIVKITLNQSDAKMELRRDVNAAPQTIVILSGPHADSIAALVHKQAEKLREYFEQAERNRVIENTKKYQDVNLYMTVQQLFGGAPAFPQGYTVRKKTDRFIWIDYNLPKAMQGILIFSYPYKNQADFETANMVAAQNKILKEQVPSSRDDSYMKIDDVLPPEVQFLRYNNLHFASMRGLWDVENGHMGGPFVSHSYISPDGKNMVVVLAFVYAPGDKKRNYIRQTESIIYSFEWTEQEQGSET